MNSQAPKLKPIVYTESKTRKHSPQTTQQIILLKAMQVTQDPKELRRMIGVRSVAEVYRTLDKLAMRQEYHEALARAGISFDFVVSGIRDIATSGEKDGDRLKAYQTLLKSLGLDKYDAAEAPTGGTWEEELLKALDKKETPKALPSGAQKSDENPDYEVKTPVVPDSVKQLRREEEELTKGIYG